MRPTAPTSLAQAGPAPAPAPELGAHEGDDIGRARRFCDVARTAMDAVITASRDTDACPGRCAHFLSGHLSDIQTAAKLARARAVYRSAQDALSAIQSRGPHLPIDWARVDGRLLTLNKLLGQFEAGVVEMEDAFALRAPDAPAAGHPAASNDSVRDTLYGLLPHAGEAERAALLRLIRWRDREGEPADRVAEVIAAPAEPSFALSDSMPERVQDWLGLGREYGKSVSVSYGLEDVRLSASARDALLARLDARVRDVVASSMPLQGIGHLDIGYSDGALEVSGSGFAPFRIEAGGAQAPAPAPARAPMITPDVEAELRAQLGALMEPDSGLRAGG